MTFLSGLSFTASQGFGASAAASNGIFLLFKASNYISNENLSNTATKVCGFLVHFYPLTSGAILSAATGSIFPFIATFLWGTTTITAHLFNLESVYNNLKVLPIIAFIVNTVANAVFLCIQPSFYHGACLFFHFVPVVYLIIKREIDCYQGLVSQQAEELEQEQKLS